MSCKANKIIEEIAKILSNAILAETKSSKKGVQTQFSLAIQGKQSDNCKNNKRRSKNYVK